MNEYWFESGLLWTQIIKAVFRSGKTLTISGEGITVDGNLHEFYEGVVTIAQLEDILRDSI